MAIRGHLKSLGEGRDQRLVSGLYTQSRRWQTKVEVKPRFGLRRRAKGNAKEAPERSAVCVPLTNIMLDVRDHLLASLRSGPPSLSTLL
jgi:hypothetical protein